MKKLCFIVLISFIFYSCSTFNPGSIQYRPALLTPGNIEKDNIFVYAYQYNLTESNYLLDSDLQSADFRPVYMSIYNKSNDTVFVNPLNIHAYIDINEINSSLKCVPITYFFIWSIPWVINLVAHLPFYYGIAFPIFGLISALQSDDTNTEIEMFLKSNALNPTNLIPKREVYGIVFITKGKEIPFSFDILKKDSTKINFKFDNINFPYNKPEYFGF